MSTYELVGEVDGGVVVAALVALAAAAEDAHPLESARLPHPALFLSLSFSL